MVLDDRIWLKSVYYLGLDDSLIKIAVLLGSC